MVLISCKSSGFCIGCALVPPAGAAVAGRAERTRLPSLIGSLSHPVPSETSVNMMLAIRLCHVCGFFLFACCLDV